jgi:alkylated DNA repair dioxygenase AlkB
MSNNQIDLFTSVPLDIPGASYVPEFVSLSEEQDLITHIDAGSWSHEFARRRQHFGMDYAKPNSTTPTPLPHWINAVAERIVAARLFSKMPSQALVNEYLPGQGISAHKDYPPFDEVASLSLLSGCLMEFVKPPAHITKTIWLEPRSLLLLTGEARHEWTHAIRPRLNDVVNGQKIPRQRRLSLTFRTLPGSLHPK